MPALKPAVTADLGRFTPSELLETLRTDRETFRTDRETIATG